MDFLSLYGFSQPLWFVVYAILLLIFLYFSQKYTPTPNFIALDLIAALSQKSSWMYRAYIFLLLFLSFILICMLAGPYKNYSIETQKKNGVDIEIVFDLSYSMIATDITPSRIEVAKKVLHDFIGELSTDRVGIVLFAGQAFTSVPLTYDYDFLQEFINQMGVETIQQQYQRFQGTAIGDGLLMASEVLFRDSSPREKVIILITDGEANKGVDPELALKLLKDRNIKTHTIGVGQGKETTITLAGPGGFPQKVLVSGVDVEMLTKIAEETGGTYFQADSKDTFENILRTITALEKKELETQQYSFHTSQNWIFALIFFVFSLPFGFLLFFKKIRF